MNDLEYQVRSSLESYIKMKRSQGIKDYIRNRESQIGVYALLLPLIDLEFNLLTESAESISNFVRRNTVGFIFKNILPKNLSEIPEQKITINQLNEYQQNDYNTIQKMASDTRTLFEIHDSNSYAKSKIERVSENKYKLITSLVTNKYKAESIYFYGLNNLSDTQEINLFIRKQINKFASKYNKSPQMFEKLRRLHIDIDNEMLDYASILIDKDLDKLGNNLISQKLGSIRTFRNVLILLYYLAFVTKLQTLHNIENNNLEKLLLVVDKDWLIHEVNKLFKSSIKSISDVVNYLLNENSSNILEFPLHEVNGKIITAPSLIMVNDWQFTLVNGHYIKDIQFKNRISTISITTQNELIKKLNEYNNIAFDYGQNYNYINEQKKKINGEIDFIIYDKISKQSLIIETKWKENHYENEIDIRHVKVQDTLNKIYKKQLNKHSQYLTTKERFESLFRRNALTIETLPNITYIAVDKRDQLHIDGKHMITEYMLIFFINKNTNGDVLDLNNLIKEIGTLTTKVEYIYDNSDTIEHIINSELKVETVGYELYLDY